MYRSEVVAGLPLNQVKSMAFLVGFRGVRGVKLRQWWKEEEIEARLVRGGLEE